MSIYAWKIRAEMICSQHPDELPALDHVCLEQIEPQQASSLDALTQIIPGGAYTSFRTFDGSRVLHLNDHLSRLENTASMVEKPLWIDRTQVRKSMKAALRIAQLIELPITERLSASSQDKISNVLGQASIELNDDLLRDMEGLLSFPASDFRFRLTLDLQEHTGDLYLALQPLSIPGDQAYRQGVPVITHTMQRLLPKAKLTRFIQRSGEVRQAMPSSVHETLMVDENGFILEGLSSNFFAVIAGEVWTAEEGVLSGITRSLVLEGIKELGIGLHLQPVRLADASEFEEVFITSSSRAVLPVNRIDDCLIRCAPGPVTSKLMDAYARAVEESLEEIY